MRFDSLGAAPKLPCSDRAVTKGVLVDPEEERRLLTNSSSDSSGLGVLVVARDSRLPLKYLSSVVVLSLSPVLLLTSEVCRLSTV